MRKLPKLQCLQLKQHRKTSSIPQVCYLQETQVRNLEKQKRENVCLFLFHWHSLIAYNDINTARALYAYPASSDSEDAPSHSKPPSYFERLLLVKQELASLEADLSKPDQHPKKSDGDPAELIKGVHEVKAQLEKIGRRKIGRGKLVDTVVSSSGLAGPSATRPGSSGSVKHSEGGSNPLAGLDARLGELERLVGSSSAALDEVSPSIFTNDAIIHLTAVFTLTTALASHDFQTEYPTHTPNSTKNNRLNI